MRWYMRLGIEGRAACCCDVVDTESSETLRVREIKSYQKISWRNKSHYVASAFSLSCLSIFSMPSPKPVTPKTHRPSQCGLRIQRPSAVALLQAGATSAEAEREIQKWSPAHHTSIVWLWLFGFWLRTPLKITPVEPQCLSTCIRSLFPFGCQGW